MKNKDVILRAALEEYLTHLQVAVRDLEDALQHCQQKPLDDRYHPRKLESFDALAMRFSRTSDIFTQKVLRSVLSLLREESATFLDMTRVAEKIDLISSASDLVLMRDIRNSITHEYVLENWKEIFDTIIKYTPLLLEDIEKTRFFVKNKFGL